MNNTEIVYSIIKLLLHWTGLVTWSYCFLLLMEVIVCKDARMLNINKLFELSFKRRYKIFKRNLKNLYYLASVFLLVASLFALCQLSLEMWANSVVSKSIRWSIFHPLISTGIFMLYRSFGYKVTYIQKIREFLQSRYNVK